MHETGIILPKRYNASSILFENIEAGRSEKVAVRCGDQEWTYGDMCSLAARVGNGLRDLGLEAESRVMLLLLDTPRLPAAFMGAIRAGYVPIPTNTVLSAEDYAFLLTDSEAATVIVDAPLYSTIAGIRDRCPDLRHVIVVGEGQGEGTIRWAEWTGAASSSLTPAPTGNADQAFWLYSSGSTGFPKGVVHLQKNIFYTVENYAKQVLGVQERDVTFSASKAFHAYGLGNNITFPYAVGASTVLFPGRPTPATVFEHIERYRPTLFFAAPTLYSAMLAATEGEQALAPDLSSVRACVSAAEALPPNVYHRWQRRFGLEILDGIGSTEMLHIFISNRPGRSMPGSSGTVVPGYRARIVDPDGQAVPVGHSGDLLVSGQSAAPKYWRRPERTEKTMRGEWMFTGDRYYHDEDGYFFYEGRSDDMFKVSGQWVSPIEIENTLLEHAAIHECAVVPYKDSSGLTRPRAIVVLEDGFAGGAELATELQNHVKDSIAPHKYPRTVDFVDELPKTVTGKIQRFRLRSEGG